MGSNKIWVLTDGIVLGLAYALIIFVVGAIQADPQVNDLYLRAFFGFVLGVCSKRAVDGTMIELASDTPPRFGRYHYGWAIGSMWGLAMVLAFWPLSLTQAVILTGAGLLLGAIVAVRYRPIEVSPDRSDLYDVSKHIYSGWHPLWRIWPGLFLVCIIGATVFVVADDSAQSPYLILGLAAALINNAAPFQYRHRALKALNFVGVIAIIAGYLAL